jgi:hypothetical protein
MRYERAAEARRMRLNGAESAVPTDLHAVHHTPTKSTEAARASRLRTYLATSPRGERDVEPLLDALAKERAPREKWLRAVLIAVED